MSKKNNREPIHENKYSKETISIIYPNDFSYYHELNALIPETVFGMEYLEKYFPDYIDISKENLSVIYPKDFYFSKTQNALFPSSVFAMKYLNRLYPVYLAEILSRKSVRALQGWNNVTGDIRIGYIAPDAVADESWIMFFEENGYLARAHEYKSFGTMFNDCVFAAALRIITHEYGYKYIKVRKTGIGADGKKYRYTEYMRMSEQKHSFNEDGTINDTWDIFHDSLRLYPYCYDTAVKACNNITLKRFYESLTIEEKKILRWKTMGETNTAISKRIGKSHTIVNRKIDKMKRIIKKEIVSD